MAYKSLTGDLKTIRNQIQDNTENPYTSAAKYGSTTKYVFALGIKELTGTSPPTNPELFDTSQRSNLPLIVTMTLIGNPAGPDLAGESQLLGVLVRCIVAADSKWKFKTLTIGAEEIALEKLNEISYELTNNATIISAFAAAGLRLDKGTGISTIRPFDTENRQDYGYAMELTFLRESVQ